jgi:uncharacterized protein
MAKTGWIIDSDAHVTEPRDVWTSRLPQKYLEEAPHVEVIDGVDAWVIGNDRVAAVGASAVAGWPTNPIDFPPRFEDCHPAAYQAAERLKYLDEAGIWAQVLYPNVGGFGGDRFLRIVDDKLKLLCVQAYNDFLLEWCSVDPQRLLPILATPFWDVEATVAEVERCGDLGARGILFTGEPQRFGLPLIGSRHWDPLWSVATERGLAIHFHIGSGGDSPALMTPERFTETGVAATQTFGTVSLYLKNGVQTADLLTSGMLPRWPGLKFVSVESGIGWVPFVLEAADYSWLSNTRVGRQKDSGDMLPSEQFAQHVYVTHWFEQVAPTHLLDTLPIDNILFETDFPHISCLYGDIPETIERSLGHLSEGDRQKILWQNAAELYNIPQPSA